jgi:hypothetical protein
MEAADLINQPPKIRLKFAYPGNSAGSALTFNSSLRPKLHPMVSLNSIAAVAQEIAANAGIIQVRSPVQPVDVLRSNVQGQPSQRSLEAVPPAPATPLPRGSLLDLRV